MDSDAQAYIDAVATAGGSTNDTAVDNFITTLKADGLWAKADALGFFKLSGSVEAAMICMKRLTEGEMRGGLTWDDETGFTGDGIDDHFRTLFNPSNGTPNYSQNSASYAVRYKDGTDIDTTSSGGIQTRVRAWNTDPSRMDYRANAGSGTISGTGNTPTMHGLIGVNRSGASAVQLNINGSEVDTNTDSSTALKDNALYVLGLNINDAGGNNLASAQNNTAEFYWVGGSLTSTEWGDLNTAVNQYFIDAEVGFAGSSPVDGATGVSKTPTLEITDDEDLNEYNFRLSPNLDMSSPVADGFSTSKSYQVPVTLAASTQYYWEAWKYTDGGFIDPGVLYTEDFVEADQDGWPGWTDSTLTGTGDVKIASNLGVMEAAASSVVVANLDEEINNTDIELKFNTTDISSDFQPSVHFRTQNTWLANNQIEGYYLFWNGTGFQLGRVSGGNPADFSGEIATISRTADIDYTLRVMLVDYRIRVAVWASSSSQNGWDIDFEDTNQFFATGGLSLKLATTASLATTEQVKYSLVELSVSEEAPVITNIDVTENTATIHYDTVIRDNDGYEYELDDSGTWVPVSTTNPIPLDTDDGIETGVQSSAKIRPVHDGVAGPESDPVTFTPQAPHVDSISISGSSTIRQDGTVELEVDVQVTGDTSTAFTASSSNTNDVTVSVSGNKIIGTHQSGGEVGESVTIEAKATADETKTATHDLEIIEALAGSRSEDEKFLVSLAVAMDSDGWDDNTGWGKTSMSLDDTIYGVTAETVNGEKRVVWLDLQRGSTKSNPQEPATSPSGEGNGLTNRDGEGNLIAGRECPDPIVLTECEYYNLKSNEITGPVPAGQFQMAKAKRIMIAGTPQEPDFGSGDIAPYYHPVSDSGGGGKTELGRNFWTESLPSSVNAPECEVLECMQAMISGQIPTAYNGTNLPKCKMLLLNGSGLFSDDFKISGEIPVQIYTITTLRYLYLGVQRLTGSIHNDIGQLTDLRHLRFNDNGNYDWSTKTAQGGLSGELPVSMEAMRSHLQLVTVKNNSLEGNPLFMLKDGSRLHTFSISFNNFSGTIDPNLKPHGSFNVLGLGRNGFTGEVPRWVTEVRLIQVNLDNANFTSLHSEFGNPNCVLYDGHPGGVGRLRNLRLEFNPNLDADLPKPNWLKPSNFRQVLTTNSYATFRNTDIDGSTYDIVEDGREKDQDDDGTIVQKTRRQWYEHYWQNTNF